ncbi:PIN domain-containing protein [Rhizobium sp.]
MIVIDTNVISEINKERPDRHVLSWFDGYDPLVVFLTDVTMMEIVYGAERHLIKHRSDKYYRFFDGIAAKFKGQILGLNGDAFLTAGRIRAQREMSGRMMSPQDAMISAICLQHGATLATRNTKDFEGLDLKLVNPFEGA